MANDTSVKTSTSSGNLAWFSILKGIAILMVLLHHYADLKHSVVWQTPAGIGPSLAAGWQFARSVTHDVAEAVLYLWAGLCYQGVHVFIAASGFGLALSDSRRRVAQPYRDFLKRRALRLLPPYWVLVGLLILSSIAVSLFHLHNHWIAGSSKKGLIIDILLIRNFSERTIWIYPGQLWYIPLIIQLYLLYPLLAAWNRRSPALMLTICGIITVAYRIVAEYALHSAPLAVKVDGLRWTPMLFCLARLFEFAFGIWFASWFVNLRARGRELPALKLGFIGLLLWLAGTCAACYRVGWIVSDPLIGAGLFPLCCALGIGLEPLRVVRVVLEYFGRKSYSLYLMHTLLLGTPLVFHIGHLVLLGFALFCLVSAVLAEILDAILALPAKIWAWRTKSSDIAPTSA